MRALLLMVPLVAFSCSPASIGEYPETPIEKPEPSEDDDGGAGVGDGGGSGQSFKLTVTIDGPGAGTVTSTPSGIKCQDRTCTGNFAAGTTVGLVPAPAQGSTFTSWGGACSGNGICTPVMNADVAVTATMSGGGALAGTFTGTYTNTRQGGTCTFQNNGTLTMAFTQEGTGVSAAGTMTGLQLRDGNNCQVVGTGTGTSQREPVVMGATTTGTWTFTVPNVAGTIAFSYTATLAGTQLTGTWTCPTCTGNFTLTRQ